MDDRLKPPKWRKSKATIDSNSKWRLLRNSILGLALGLFVSAFIYGLVLVDLDFQPIYRDIFAVIICLLVTCGCTLSPQVRCITLLSMPSLMGRTGRSVLKALLITYIISGPITNLLLNSSEVIRVFGCATVLTYNLTKTKFELMLKPFQVALYGMKDSVPELKEKFRVIKNLSNPLAEEIEGTEELVTLRKENNKVDAEQNNSRRSDFIETKYQMNQTPNEAEKYEKQYLKKTEYRCESLRSKATETCRVTFQASYDKCYKKISRVLAWLVCWPMKLTFICNIFRITGGSKACDPSDYIESGFGAGYAQLKKAEDEIGDVDNVQIQYEVTKIKEVLDLQDGMKVYKVLTHQMKQKKEMIDYVMMLAKRFLSLILLRIMFKAQKYHDYYLRNIDFDNIYITKYFRKLDAKRRAKGKTTILPLKKMERSKLVDPLQVKPIRSEKEELLGQTAKLGIEAITATSFILLDRLLYGSLSLVAKHAKMDISQAGYHETSVQILGTGVLASLLRTIVRSFDVKKRIKIIKSNEECLPRPYQTSIYYCFKIYGVISVIWLSILCQAYTQRLQHVICSYFYPKMEKNRILHLYNKTLRKRTNYIRYMRTLIRRLAHEQRLKDARFNFVILYKLCPFIKRYMKRRRCLICSDKETRKRPLESCPNPACDFFYCLECWSDVGRVCFACIPGSSPSDASVMDDDENS